MHKIKYEDDKHELVCLTPSLFFNFTCNRRHELKLDFGNMKSFAKKITCKKGGKNGKC